MIETLLLHLFLGPMMVEWLLFATRYFTFFSLYLLQLSLIFLAIQILIQQIHSEEEYFDDYNNFHNNYIYF